jgi:hypothetical protein
MFQIVIPIDKVKLGFDLVLVLQLGRPSSRLLLLLTKNGFNSIVKVAIGLASSSYSGLRRTRKRGNLMDFFMTI